MSGWHLHRHHRGPQFLIDTTNTGWGLLSGHQWGPPLGHQWGLFHGHGQLFRHWNAGRSQVQIYKALNIDRKTIRKYLAPALAEGLARSPDEPFDEEVFCCCMEPNDSYDRLIH